MFYRWQRLRLSVSHGLHNLNSGLIFIGRILRSRVFVFPLLLFVAALFYGRYITELNLFVFHDDGEMIVHETYTTDIMQALEEAGIFISKTDYVTAPQYPIRGSVAEVVIERSHWVNVFYDGRTFAVPTTGSTVAGILEQTGFESRHGDVIVPSPDTETVDDMNINVYRANVSYETAEEEIGFESVVRPNSNLNYKTEVVVQDGIPGKKVYTYEVTTVEGVEIDRALIETVVVEPVPKIIEQGVRKTVTMRDGTVLAYTRKLECTATAYTTENRTRKINALGNIARPGTIAVDRKVIPLRSKVYVCGPKGPSQWEYGIALCEDVGGFSGNHVDLFMDTYDACIQFGKRKCLVYVLS